MRLRNFCLFAVSCSVTLVLSCAGLFGWHLYQLWQSLPAVDHLSNYQAAMPLRILARDGSVLAEFGEERREILPLVRIPLAMRHALLAIEDAGFYEHGPVNYVSFARAVWINLLTHRHAQGGSTITMQVARQFFLSPEKTYDRKLREILLSYKLEQTYSKDKLLELYMNQIYLGARAYGFSAAANMYFGRPLDQLTVAEYAMLAGLPKAPSAYNPIVNPARARVRQQYILKRMRELQFISAQDYDLAMAQEVKVQTQGSAAGIAPEVAYPVEWVRRMLLAQYGDQAYRLGLDVSTTLDRNTQVIANQALRDGLLRTQQLTRAFHVEGRVKDLTPAGVRHALQGVPNRNGLQAGVILSHTAKQARAMLRDGTLVDLSGKSLPRLPAGQNWPGAVVYLLPGASQSWQIVALPEMEGALVSLDVHTGDVTALVGGFDFATNKFDHALQAYRQPGSCFKPFVYSAALEKGYFPGTLVDDTQRLLTRAETGAAPWRPKNYGGRYAGFISARQGLVHSKNMVAVSLMQAAGADYVQQFAQRFGFEDARNPANLPLALGAGSVTPMQLTQAYGVFASGGYLVQPRLITRVHQRGVDKDLYRSPEQPEQARVIPARNAYLMDSLLQDVVRSGTGRGAASVARTDVAGKTGTSNQANDAWFAGYSSGLVTVVWLGYDQARTLGAVTGGTLALPIWTQFMKTAVSTRPEPTPVSMPEGIVFHEEDMVYREFTQDACLEDDHPFILSDLKCPAHPVGEATAARALPAPVSEQERAQILHWFDPRD